MKTAQQMKEVAPNRTEIQMVFPSKGLSCYVYKLPTKCGALNNCLYRDQTAIQSILSSSSLTVQSQGRGRGEEGRGSYVGYQAVTHTRRVTN
ncbi:hypothetical protein BaRGS_00010250 [Batillaria attramentaria]|uniref:Uncharacterized protein n=1 Tax=Batillaria attramentaria TaxID=370345 RepID=A0ABD0LGL6_9CAEN